MMTVDIKETQQQRQRLHDCTNAILDAGKYDYAALYAACNNLYELLKDLGGVDEGDHDQRKDMHLNQGNAIGPTWAGLCVRDIMRTKRFMDGVYEAVKDLLRGKVDQPVHILYAGTGPFATLVLPLVARFTSRQVQFTLLEVNELTLSQLRQVCTTLQLQEYIHGIHLADASTWTIPAGEMVDLVVSETMRRGLRAEPQVPIFMNLVPQLPAHAVIIPQQVVLSAACMKGGMVADDAGEAHCSHARLHLLGEIFGLTKAMVIQHHQAAGSGGDGAFPARWLPIGDEVTAVFPHLHILTHITVYGQHELRMNESGLTLPVWLANLQGQPAGTIRFQYIMGPNPDWSWAYQPS